MNPATASFSVLFTPCLMLIDPEQLPGALQHWGGGSGSFQGRKAACRGEGGCSRPWERGHREPVGHPCPACIASSQGPSLLFFRFWCISSPAQPAGAQSHGQDSAHGATAAASPAQVVMAGTEGLPDLASSSSEGSTEVSACWTSLQREQQWPPAWWATEL